MGMEHISARNDESDCHPSPGQYPWLVNLPFQYGENENLMFCTMKPSLSISDALIQSRQVPELCGKLIMACCHGWLILSNDEAAHEIVLWNPITLESIRLPTLTLKLRRKIQDLSFDFCYLTSTPDNPDSVLMLFRYRVTSIFMCPLRDKRWSQIWYARQIKDVTSVRWDYLIKPVYCNGKLYAVTQGSRHLVSIDIVKPGNRLIVTPLLCQLPPYPASGYSTEFLVESCGELLDIFVKYKLHSRFMLNTFVFKLNFCTMTWEKVESSKDRIYFLDESQIFNFSCRSFDSQADGNYLHLINYGDDGIYSYNMLDKTMSVCYPFGAKSVYVVWVMPKNRDCDGEAHHDTDIAENKECRSTENLSTTLEKVEENTEASEECKSTENLSTTLENVNTEASEALCLLDLPLDILKRITDTCPPVECLHFRATSKLCRSVLPSIPWKTIPTRLHKCSLLSPWLVFSDKDKGIMTFIDPKLGDRYYTTFPEFIGDGMVCSSKDGWLLIARGKKSLLFFNPFTRASVELPELLPDMFTKRICSYSFSSRPTCSDCMVAAFSVPTDREIYVTSPRSSGWRKFEISVDIPYKPGPYSSPIFYGRDFYALNGDGKIGVFKIGPDYRWEILMADSPKTCLRSSFDRYLVECDNDLLYVSVASLGSCVEVFKLNQSSLVWDEVKSLGKHMIYVCPSVSFSAVAKAPEMENKIYFPRYSDGNIVYYSLDTCKFHTFRGKEEPSATLYNTREQMMCSWIEPSWCQSDDSLVVT